MRESKLSINYASTCFSTTTHPIIFHHHTLMAPRMSLAKKASLREALDAAGPKPDVKAIALTFEISVRAIRRLQRTRRQEKKYGRSLDNHRIGGVPKITQDIKDAVVSLVKKYPWVHQDEIADYIYDGFEVRVEQPTVSRLLKELAITKQRCSRREVGDVMP